MNWWKILKNAKVSGKATGKGSSFDASKVKINIEKDDCKKKLANLLESGLSLEDGSRRPTNILYSFFQQDFLNQMPEERACEYLKTIKYKFPQKMEGNYEKLFQIYPVPKSQSGLDYYYASIDKYEGEGDDEGDIEISITFKQEYITWARLWFTTNQDYAEWLALA